jgi:hypothetical protein
MATKAEVKSFLNDFHTYLKVWDIIFLDDRSKNFQAIANLEITPALRKETIAKLDVEDYSQGPIPETNHGWTDMWIFGKIVKSVEVYIKVTLGLKNKPKCICISFHEAEHAMHYPFKEATK